MLWAEYGAPTDRVRPSPDDESLPGGRHLSVLAKEEDASENLEEEEGDGGVEAERHSRLESWRCRSGENGAAASDYACLSRIRGDLPPCESF